MATTAAQSSFAASAPAAASVVCTACDGSAVEAGKARAGCAPRMADGRIFTDYRPRCDVAMQYATPMTSSYDYRQWLVHNGKRIIDHQRSVAFSYARCWPCSPISTMPLEKDKFRCDKLACARVPTEFPSEAERVRAFGTGRDT